MFFRRMHLYFLRTLAQKITLDTMCFNFLIFRKEKQNLWGQGSGGVTSETTRMT